MKLSEAGKRRNYRIEKIQLTEDVKRRILALGLTEDTVIFVEEKKNNGPMIIRARGARLAIGRKFCQGIIVGEMEA